MNARTFAGTLLALSMAASNGAAHAQYFELGTGEHLSPAALERALQSNARDAATLGIPTWSEFVQRGVRGARIVARTGAIGMVVIPALFADSPEPPIDQSELARILFEGPNTPGTVKEFYEDASGGLFTVLGEVTDWVRTSVTVLEAAGTLEGHGWIGPEINAWVRNALALADATVNFAEFDNDGSDGIANSGDDNGVVDGVILMQSTITGACGGPGVWPHFGVLRDGNTFSPYVTDDAGVNGSISIAAYIVTGATDCTGVTPEGPGVVAHEMGHLLGLPDYYVAVTGIEPTRRHWTIGCFDIMAAGAWGCGTGPQAIAFGPTRFSPLSRQRLGWLSFQDIAFGTDQVVTLPPSATATSAYRIPLGNGREESYLIEYRPQTGFDEVLPAGGILVYHVDGSVIRGVGTTSPIPTYPYYLVEADGDNALRKLQADGGNRGVADDVFGLGISSFPGVTTPPAVDHAGNPTGLTIEAMEVDELAGTASVRIIYDPVLTLTRVVYPGGSVATIPIELRLHVSRAAGPITAAVDQTTLPEGLSMRLAGDTVVVDGSPLDVGFFNMILEVEDGTNARTAALPLQVLDIDIPATDLAHAVVSPTASAVPPHVLAYLDRAGNRNQQIDVGDLRAYAQRTNLFFRTNPQTATRLTP